TSGRHASYRAMDLRHHDCRPGRGGTVREFRARTPCQPRRPHEGPAAGIAGNPPNSRKFFVTKPEPASNNSMAFSRNGIRPIFRRLRRSPLFTFLTLLTLAIGIGANTAIFSVINAVLLKPLLYPDPDGRVGVWHTAPGLNIKQRNSAPANYFTYREEGRSFEQFGLW